ncbi:MAG: recombinase family protein [Acidobacteria bacterium]|nr:MAG: recombinase family protein [Acidobacteriota bacterium]
MGGRPFARSGDIEGDRGRSIMKRAVIYARVSTLRQDESMQLNDLRELAKRHEWDVVTEYIDRGVSGSKESREELDKMMKDATRKKFDVVMVWKFDRFARSMKHLVTALEQFRILGIDFVSHQEAVDTATPMGTAMFGMIAVMAQFERELIRERVRAGLENAKRKGVQLGRHETRFDVQEAIILRREGVSWGEISKRLGVSKTVVYRRLQGEG